MEWRMEQVEVNIGKKGMILVEQKDPLGNESPVIELHPSQIDVVCQWLKEARDEAVRLVKAGELPEEDERQE